ncbi:tetratricopeptide repeat-containing sensor histidine kinase [Flavihumibacter profundi]|uniref:tetratricopeptide repeat-containing sensor histidine kinase n=1 Tax=Flavihumibacter profundi TaxID=2716883 RepID=UPI001CC7B826|nr:tetratricopeptide repeat-containing sensor histidine kinase [Flavihumibacter profundi]MBZ5858349.1 tetratricopeptide repeat-containing sensor histidine kinase [Flavihumibacter profundi]
MSRILICFYCLMSFQFVMGQDDIIQETNRKVESVLRQFGTGVEENKRFDLILALFGTGVESYPGLVFETAQKLYTISQKNKDIICETAAWSFYGQSYRLSANYIKGLECHHKAIALAEKSGNKSLLALAQNQMAHIYKDREEYDKALRLYTVAKDNARLGVNEQMLLWPMMNLGAVFLGTNQLDSSLFYSMQVYEKGLKNDMSRNLPYILSNIGGAYSKLGNATEAARFFKLAVDSAIQSGSNRYLYFAYLGLAEHYQRYKQQDSSIYYSKKAIEAVQHTVFSYLSFKPARLLTDMYENSNADSTIKYLKIYRAANDSLFNTRANQQLQMMTFEEDQRQQELAAQRISYQNKIRTSALLAGLLAISLIGLILYRNNRQKQKANSLLQQQKEEIESTLAQLKSTQTQLIQSEKMASLGELTAGIAHEIQNPLNFVNNFSEINKELLAEMKEEMDKGNLVDAKSIAGDLIQNEEKINHHGKRADAIVKGMLQHSRLGSGMKEPTDINALADEYLRLAYHGLRAKDKSFNANMKTDFDVHIGNVNVVPQDIGRVILNLITNAFYAVNEKKSHHPENYDPTIFVSTKKLNNWLEIKVADNGPGIPKKVMDKIFQPFFTTKPTGQGTGLGLSLSYDIIKAHGGHLKVETKDDEGATFIIQLPLT